MLVRGGERRDHFYGANFAPGAVAFCPSRGRDISLPDTAESPRGISPRGAHRTVRDCLQSHGSCHPLRAAALRHNQSAPPVASWPS